MTQATVTPSGTQSVDLSDAQQPVVQKAIAQINEIATLPEVTMRIIRLVEDPSSSAKDLNQVISHDPALGARILKVVNSSFYGLPGQIGSIDRAIVLLGLNALKNVAIAASLAKLFRGGRICASFDARDLCTHCIAVGVGTQMLAKNMQVGLHEEAFLVGLIHDLGIMVQMQAARDKMIKALDALERDPDLTFRQAELAAFGVTHEHFGAALCRLWKFPACFAVVAGNHHRPLELTDQHRSLTMLVHVADVLAARGSVGYSRTVDSTQIDPAVIDQLELDDEVIATISEQLPTVTDETWSMLR